MERVITALTLSKVDLPHFHDLHVHHGSGARGDLLRPSTEWLDLHLGCRERWSQVCSILRFHRRLVDLRYLDDVRRELLSGMHIVVPA